MSPRKTLAALFALYNVAGIAATSRAQPQNYRVANGVTLRARAYTDYSGPLQYASRYSMEIATAPKDGTKWDFTLQNEPDYYYTGGVSGATFPTTYNNKPTATLRPTLHQYAVYEERLTFKNLDLAPAATKGSRFDFGAKVAPRALLLKKPVTLTTPSGISVTLPAQNAATLTEVFRDFNGNANALFVKVNISPDAREVRLPASPLCKKYGKPVSIKLEAPEPGYMASYEADNTFKTLAIGLPNLRTLAHLDSLTLIVRQRVELQTVPVALEVPVERPAKN